MSSNIFIPEKHFISAADVKSGVKQGPSVMKTAQENLCEKTGQTDGSVYTASLSRPVSQGLWVSGSSSTVHTLGLYDLVVGEGLTER